MDASVLAFTGAAFPRAVQMAEEDIQAKIDREDLVLRHLFTLVIGWACKLIRKRAPR